MNPLRIAIPKGRLRDRTIGLFKEAGLPMPSQSELRSRKLRFRGANDSLEIETMLVKDGDVTVYVDHGVADLGVAGSDQILERDCDLFMPAELSFGDCRLMLIGRRGVEPLGRSERVRIATKYPKIARRALADRALQLEVIELQGSVELAAVLGLTDYIVDLVETGATIRENDLVPIETILEVRPRLIVNKTSYRTRPDLILPVIERIREISQTIEDRSSEGVNA
ncbi:MAG: ATP phosphoribosyltransferase [Thermoanaerobaculia bacterium]|nr:ATP phosphoribosyltransferase [Thermoanaerobaculia bacterium]